jgi:hypothetical protein
MWLTAGFINAALFFTVVFFFESEPPSCPTYTAAIFKVKEKFNFNNTFEEFV